MPDTYFFDTYALLEMIMGNAAYQTITNGKIIVTTNMNLLELHYYILRNYSQEQADNFYDAFKQCVVAIDDATIKKASVLKAQYKKRKLSYVDCIGYIIASSMSIPFLTGDKEFEDLENVCFVK